MTSVAPTFEVHVNSPLTHRDWFNANDPTGTADVVDLTYGLNVTFFKQSVVTLGMVTPVTGPRPFNYEAVLLFNWRFGRSRGSRCSTDRWRLRSSHRHRELVSLPGSRCTAHRAGGCGPTDQHSTTGDRGLADAVTRCRMGRGLAAGRVGGHRAPKNSR